MGSTRTYYAASTGVVHLRAISLARINPLTETGLRSIAWDSSVLDLTSRDSFDLGRLGLGKVKAKQGERRNQGEELEVCEARIGSD